MKLGWSWAANLPMSYLVQEHNDPVTGEYLARIGVQMIELFSWNELPEHELPGARMLLTRLRDHGSAIVIVCSSRRNESEVLASLQAGAVGYLCKDTLTPEALASAVRASSPPRCWGETPRHRSSLSGLSRSCANRWRWR